MCYGFKQREEIKQQKGGGNAAKRICAYGMAADTKNEKLKIESVCVGLVTLLKKYNSKKRKKGESESL